jgi:steroid delta-isomerase-like uncharacterized protein
MTTEDVVSRRRSRLLASVEAFNQHRIDGLRELFANDVVLFRLGSPEPVRGIEEYLAYDRRFLEAFPDAHIDVRNVIVEGESAALEFVMRGHHRGVFRNLQPTGREIAVPVVEMLTFSDDKVSEVRRYVDNATYDQQLGPS